MVGQRPSYVSALRAEPSTEMEKFAFQTSPWLYFYSSASYNDWCISESGLFCFQTYEKVVSTVIRWLLACGEQSSLGLVHKIASDQCSQTFWSWDSFKLLKIIEESKELLFVYVNLSIFSKLETKTENCLKYLFI